MSPPMSREERLALNRERQRAVREAWARERQLCAQGRGTRDWTPQEQQELLSTGRVRGYEGQHMKSVSRFPQQAGNPNNIQFLTHQEHLAAHNSGRAQSGYRAPTNGCYNPDTGRMRSFGHAPPTPPKAVRLSRIWGQETGPSQARGAARSEGVQQGAARSAAAQPGAARGAAAAQGRGISP